MEATYDAIVVGSGFGGGIAACRLAEAGWRVCVLERGRRFEPGDLPDQPADLPFALWHARLNPNGMFDLRLMRDITVLTAAGVGGGSLVYANVQLRAPAAVFAAGWPKAINRAELDPYYDRSEDALQPRTTPTNPPLPKVEAFAAAATATGKNASLLPLAVHFGDDREHPFSGVHQKGCTNLGRCDFGCPRLARNTVDITYLARAQRFGAEIYPLHEVTWLAAPRPGIARSNWQVGYRDLQYHTTATVAAPTVVLAAGCLGTTRLLLHNRKRLPKLSPAIGSRFSTNGDALGVAFAPMAPGVEPAQTQYGPTMGCVFSTGMNIS